MEEPSLAKCWDNLSKGKMNVSKHIKYIPKIHVFRVILKIHEITMILKFLKHTGHPRKLLEH